jgi:hypothetical protein
MHGEEAQNSMQLERTSSRLTMVAMCISRARQLNCLAEVSDSSTQAAKRSRDWELLTSFRYDVGRVSLCHISRRQW